MVLTRMPRAQLMRLYKLLLDRVDAEAVAAHIVGRAQRVLHVERVEPELGGGVAAVFAVAAQRVDRAVERLLPPAVRPTSLARTSD